MNDEDDHDHDRDDDQHNFCDTDDDDHDKFHDTGDDDHHHDSVACGRFFTSSPCVKFFRLM